jgi:hypothetical protein
LLIGLQLLLNALLTSATIALYDGESFVNLRRQILIKGTPAKEPMASRCKHVFTLMA